jgi:hypothetical protein
MLARLRAVSLFALIAVAAASVLPKIDLPETAFDETETPNIQTAVTTEAASSKCISSGAAFAADTRAQTCDVQVRFVSPAYTTQSSDSRQFQKLLSTLRC